MKRMAAAWWKLFIAFSKFACLGLNYGCSDSMGFLSCHLETSHVFTHFSSLLVNFHAFCIFMYFLSTFHKCLTVTSEDLEPHAVYWKYIQSRAEEGSVVSGRWWITVPCCEDFRCLEWQFVLFWLFLKALNLPVQNPSHLVQARLACLTRALDRKRWPCPTLDASLACPWSRHAIIECFFWKLKQKVKLLIDTLIL